MATTKAVLTGDTLLSYHLHMVGTSPAPKHRQVYEALLQQIVSGRVKAGGRLPSEADLVSRFGASRITVARALRDLQAAGLVERRAGSGTYVRQARRADQALSLGMLIPDFGDVDVFTAIYRGMLDAPEAQAHSLVWTTGTSVRRHARGRGVAGVPALHRQARRRRFLRAARAHAEPARGQPPDRRSVCRRAHSDRAARSRN